MIMKIPPVSLSRTYLFVPGDRADRFDKAWDSGADQIIIDLEDAVAPTQKDAARKAAAGWMTPGRPAWVRINACDTAWYESDIELAAHPGLRGFMIPKSEHLPRELINVCREHKKSLILLVESALGFKNLAVLAETATVERLAFGSIDFQVDLGIEGDDDALAYFRSQLVLASRLAQIQPPLDGVTTDVNDAEVLNQDTLRAKRFGFGGKLCIHPRQVIPVNSLFSPSDEELGWARMVIAASAKGEGAVVTVGGKMVDKPVLAKALRIIQAAEKSAPTRRE
jgi:citrate lyase subunit beta / citryl-CoA lyase